MGWDQQWGGTSSVGGTSSEVGQAVDGYALKNDKPRHF